MNYTINWSQNALEDLKKINKPDRKRIFEKITQHLSLSPFTLGKPLKAHLKGFYRYRIGKYRVIYIIKEKEVTIIVTRIGTRGSIYKN